MKNKALKIITLSASGIFIVLVLYIGYVLNLTSGIKDNVLRLHVVANSDDADDQRVKLSVRDRIIAEFSEVFDSCTSQAESIEIATEYEEKIQKVAEDELEKQGHRESVSVEIGKSYFPTKDYKNISLPRGTYTAVNIKIGRAKGQNWWCVMYPPLCIDKGTVLMTDKSRETLMNSLSKEEYELITKGGGNIEIRFRVAEILGTIF